MHSLSERLSLIAEMAGEGESVCDVGTDHGFLAAYFSKNEKFDRIFATDIGKKPLENARKTLEKLSVQNVSLVLCDGLSELENEDIKTVIIAGMGGEVISGIISRTKKLKKRDKTLILQPMTSADKLREFLIENGFYIEKEAAVLENNKIYSVMRVKFDGKIRERDELFFKVGILNPKNKTDRLYMEKQLCVAENKAEDLKGVVGKEDEYRKNLALYEKLKNLTEG